MSRICNHVYLMWFFLKPPFTLFNLSFHPFPAARPNLNTQPQQRKRPTPTNYVPSQTARSTSNQTVTLTMTTAEVSTQRQYSAEKATRTLEPEEKLNPLKHVNLVNILLCLNIPDFLGSGGGGVMLLHFLCKDIFDKENATECCWFIEVGRGWVIFMSSYTYWCKCHLEYQ